ncbi:MAG: hypothetical protein K0V04_46050 [Deltaproteobacteria bacterium]|nr:hypothetical protein [Deltaproteobacteria bacterium]
MNTQDRITKCRRPWRRRAQLAAVTVGLLAGACDAERAPTVLRVSAYGEAYVEDRIPAEDVIDGWEIEFSEFAIAVQGIEAEGEVMPGRYIVDLREGSAGGGHLLGELEVEFEEHPLLGYRVAPVTAATAIAVSDETAATMIDEGLSILVEGQARRGGETIDFRWGFATDTHYRECHSTAEPDGGEAHSQLTIHADHLFYDDLDSPEPNVAFDLIAGADADADGEVTMQELRAVDITGEARYQVGSREISDLWGFIEAQTATLGHIDGEGHCDAGA